MKGQPAMKMNESQKYLSTGGVQLILNGVGQILIPYFFISNQGLSNYGIWVICLSTTNLLQLIDGGMISYFSTQAIISRAKGNRDNVSSLLQTLKRKILLRASIMVITVTIFIGLSQLFFRLIPIATAILLGIFVLNAALWLLIRYFEAELRTYERPIGFVVMTAVIAFDLILGVIILSYGHPMVYFAITMLLVRFIAVAFMFWVSRNASEGHAEHQKYLDRVEYLALRRGSLSYISYPLGQNLMNEGVILAVGLFAGSAIVGVVSVSKILVGVLKQVIGTITNSHQTSMGRLLAEERSEEAFDEFMKIKLYVIITCSVFFPAIVFFGSPGLRLMSHGEVTIPFLTLMAFAISALADVPWMLCALPLFAMNDHIDLSKRFLIGSVLSFALSLVFYQIIGIAGIPLGNLAIDLILTRYTINKCKIALHKSTSS